MVRNFALSGNRQNIWDSYKLLFYDRKQRHVNESKN